MLILPLLHPEAPHPRFDAPVRVALEALTTQSPPMAKPAPRDAQPAPRPTFTAPVRVPAHIAIAMMGGPLPDLPMAAPGSVAGGSPIAAIVLDLPARLPSSPPSVRPELARPAEPVHVGVGVQSAKLIFGPKPRYSAVAIAAHLEGTVKLQAVIAARWNHPEPAADDRASASRQPRSRSREAVALPAYAAERRAG